MQLLKTVLAKVRGQLRETSKQFGAGILPVARQNGIALSQCPQRSSLHGPAMLQNVQAIWPSSGSSPLAYPQNPGLISHSEYDICFPLQMRHLQCPLL